MGSKNLKAVAVRGDTPVPLFDAAEFKIEQKNLTRKFSDSLKGEPPGLRTDGIAATITGIQTVGALPTHNLQQGTFEGWEAISGRALTERFGSDLRPATPVRSGVAGQAGLMNGFQGEGEGPEYEAFMPWGQNGD